MQITQENGMPIATLDKAEVEAAVRDYMEKKNIQIYGAYRVEGAAARVVAEPKGRIIVGCFEVPKKLEES